MTITGGDIVLITGNTSIASKQFIFQIKAIYSDSMKIHWFEQVEVVFWDNI